MHKKTQIALQKLLIEYTDLRIGRESLLTLLAEVEVAEQVYNSNAIENSTLTLMDTEKILLDQEISGVKNLREIYEAKNLGSIITFQGNKITGGILISEDLILLFHKMLLTHIQDNWAGRYRRVIDEKTEWVKIGGQLTADPREVPKLMNELMRAWYKNEEHIVSRITRFHLVFETTHPFCDGNGRIGRVIINYQLESLGYPPIIVQNKEKQKYYAAFRAYGDTRDIQPMEDVIILALKESLHKRIAYLRGDEIVWLDTCIPRGDKKRYAVIMNAAKKQSLPAFRERGKWKIGKKMFQEWESS